MPDAVPTFSYENQRPVITAKGHYDCCQRLQSKDLTRRQRRRSARLNFHSMVLDEALDRCVGIPQIGVLVAKNLPEYSIGASNGAAGGCEAAAPKPEAIRRNTKRQLTGGDVRFGERHV